MLTLELAAALVVEILLGIAVAALANSHRKLLRVLRILLLVVFAVVGVCLIVLVFLGPEPFYALLGSP